MRKISFGTNGLACSSPGAIVRTGRVLLAEQEPDKTRVPILAKYLKCLVELESEPNLKSNQQSRTTPFLR